jgi:hypothetical protein
MNDLTNKQRTERLTALNYAGRATKELFKLRKGPGPLEQIKLEPPAQDAWWEIARLLVMAQEAGHKGDHDEAKRLAHEASICMRRLSGNYADLAYDLDRAAHELMADFGMTLRRRK